MMHVVVSLADDELPLKRSLLVMGRAEVDSLDGVYDALGEAMGYFLRFLDGSRGLLVHDEEAPA